MNINAFLAEFPALYHELDDSVVKSIYISSKEQSVFISITAEAYNYKTEKWEQIEIDFFNVIEYRNKLDLVNDSVLGNAQFYLSDQDQSIIVDLNPWIIPATTHEQHLQSTFYVKCKYISFKSLKAFNK